MAKKMEMLSASYVDVKATAGADLSAGDVVVGTNFVGFTLVDVANGDDYTLIRESENVRAEKATGALTIDDLVYWDNSAKNVTKTATSNKFIGYVKEAVASADTHVRISFDGKANFLKA